VKLFGWLKPKTVTKTVVVNAGYDSLRRTPENTRHWSEVDYLSADSSLEPEQRDTLRAQARYEIQENNAYGKGISQTFASDIVGTGPRLQLGLGEESLNTFIQREFGYWCQSTGLTSKLNMLILSRMIDGESIARIIQNPSSAYPLRLDLQLFEADHLTAPHSVERIGPNYVDGVHLDGFSNPYAYDLLDEHPGNSVLTNDMEHTTYKSRDIIHLFRSDRPGQHRGVSEFAPALPLFAFLRRFTLATIAAAETAASVAQVISTDAPLPEELDADLQEQVYAQQYEKLLEDSIRIDRNTATVLPNQWKLQQFAAEHPTTTFKMFKREILGEIARCVGMPAIIATFDASDSNFASGRMDSLPYRKRIKSEQVSLSRSVMDRLLSEWMVEAALMGMLDQWPELVGQINRIRENFGTEAVGQRLVHEWHWDGFQEGNQKEAANAQRLMLQNGTTHRAREYASQGLDVDHEDERAATSFGMTVEEYRKLCATSIFTNGNLVGNGLEESAPSSETETQSED